VPAKLTLATVVTMLRIALVPVFGLLWAGGHFGSALVVFAAAAASDIVDGFIARYFHQKSDLGALLDSAADKLLLLVSYLVAAATHSLPAWMAGLVIGRDVVMIFGAGFFKLALPGRYDPESWRPTRLGKYTTFSHVAVIVLALIIKAFAVEDAVPWLQTWMVCAAILTIISALQYFTRGIEALRRASVRSKEGAEDGV
jgi:cardiolipin synthase